MAVFGLARRVDLPAGESWRRVTDWRAHAAGVPLTSVVSVSPEPVGQGTVVVVRSALGRAGFDDPMEVVRWEPAAPEDGGGGRCRLEKRGRVVLGWAEIEVVPRGSGSLVLWREELRLRGLPRALDPLLAPAGRLVFGRALDGLLGRAAPGRR
jgi:hypothetical protein